VSVLSGLTDRLFGMEGSGSFVLMESHGMLREMDGNGVETRWIG